MAPNGQVKGSAVAELEKRPGEKPKGWFSRRHETSEEHSAARECYQNDHGPKARRRKAQERDEARAHLTAQQQLVQLDARLGPRVGAKSERERLLRSIQEGAIPRHAKPFEKEGEEEILVRYICRKCTRTIENPPGARRVEHTVCSECSTVRTGSGQ